GHLWRGARQAAQQGRLAGVRLAHQAGVREDLESELDPPRLSLEALLGEAGRLSRRGREALVAVPTQATGRDDRPLARLDAIVFAPFEPRDLGPGGNEQLLVRASRAVALLALAVHAPAGAKMAGALKPGEVASRRIAD